MKKCMLALGLALVFSLVAVAQTSNTSSSGSQSATTSNSSSSTDKTATSSGKEKGVTGCLEQGSSPGTYVIKNAKHPEGVQVSYSGSEDLSKHVGHKVHATGSMSGDTLNATNVKHISETCSVGETAGGHKHHHGDMTNSSTGNTSTSGTSTTNPK